MTTPVPIIDSHIHIFPASELDTLAWADPSSPLYKQHSLAEYRAAIAPCHDLVSGFIFLETDRKTDACVSPTTSPQDEEEGWKHALQEVSWLARVASGRPRPGEGHAPEDKDLCLGIVPWAPVPAGADALARYMNAVREACVRDGGDDGEAVWAKVKGFRYLLQDKPARTMLEPAFIESLRLLGRRGLVFDVGVDLHRRGRAQLEEVVEMVDRAHEGVPDGEKVTFVLNHLCKPDLTTLHPSDPAFIAWRTAMFTLSKADNVYMKLSGAFSEMSPALRQQSANDIFESISGWLAVVVAAFGPSRIMFGSDWPVCTVGVDTEDGDGDGQKDEGAWEKWRKVVDRLCWMSSMSDEDKKEVFAGTARRAYGI